VREYLGSMQIQSSLSHVDYSSYTDIKENENNDFQTTPNGNTEIIHIPTNLGDEETKPLESSETSDFGKNYTSDSINYNRFFYDPKVQGSIFYTYYERPTDIIPNKSSSKLNITGEVLLSNIIPNQIGNISGNIGNINLSEKGNIYDASSSQPYIANFLDVQYHDSAEDIAAQTDIYNPIMEKRTILDDNGYEVEILVAKTQGKFTYYEPGTYKYGASSWVPKYEEGVLLSNMTNKNIYSNTNNIDETVYPWEMTTNDKISKIKVQNENYNDAYKTR
jgi:hypothetical protein